MPICLSRFFLIRAVVDGMVARGVGRILNITTSGVKSPGTYPRLVISIGIRSGLTGFIGVLSARLHATTSRLTVCYRDPSKRIGYARTSSSQQERLPPILSSQDGADRFTL